MSKGKIHINGVYVGDAEIKIDPSLIDRTPIIIMFDNSDINNWRLHAVAMFKGDPNDLLGVIQDNIFTFLKRPSMSLLDFMFIVLNSTHEGFEVNSETEYKLSD